MPIARAKLMKPVKPRPWGFPHFTSKDSHVCPSGKAYVTAGYDAVIVKIIAQTLKCIGLFLL